MTMAQFATVLVTIIGSVLASSGFWAWLSKRHEKKDGRTQLLVGLAHDRITFLCMRYIERGSITQDEYENLYNYLYEPYVALGGNGSAKRLMKEVDRLRISVPNVHTEDAVEE